MQKNVKYALLALGVIAALPALAMAQATIDPTKEAPGTTNTIGITIGQGLAALGRTASLSSAAASASA